MEAKAANAVIEELERQAAEAPQRLSVRRQGERVDVRGVVDVDAVVMVVVGSMAGGP
jgi:hypothetical protein